jgi:uncharacterized OB-fold protein
MTITPDNTVLTPERWWEALADERLLMLRCPVCRAAWMPFMPHCPDCGRGPVPLVVESGGRGTLYSWVGIQSSISSPEEAPFVVGSVLLDEGAMIYGRVVGEPSADARVEAVFVDRGDRTTVDFEIAVD